MGEIRTGSAGTGSPQAIEEGRDASKPPADEQSAEVVSQAKQFREQLQAGGEAQQGKDAEESQAKAFDPMQPQRQQELEADAARSDYTDPLDQIEHDLHRRGTTDGLANDG